MDIFKRAWDWLDDRTNIRGSSRRNLKLTVPPGVNWWYVFGTATLAAFALQVVTGIALALTYVPSASEAYPSLQFITHQSYMGNLLRGMHFFGASAMILFIGVHMARTFLTGAYKFPREMTWITGAVLLAFTLAMGYSGQVLRWDQNGVWTVIIGAEQLSHTPFFSAAFAHFLLAGDVVSGLTLTRFFTFHVFIFPAVLFVFIAAHLYLAFLHGLSEPPVPGREVEPKNYRQQYAELLRTKGRPFWPDAAWRDTAFGVGTIVGIIILAGFFGAPSLGKPPDPSVIEALPRFDWYFRWYYALQSLTPHGLEALVIIGAPLFFGVVLLLLPFVFGRGERSPRRRPWAVGSVGVSVLVVGVLWYYGTQDPWSLDFSIKQLSNDVIGASSGSVYRGAQTFYKQGCLYCHSIGRSGGRQGPELSVIADRLTPEQMIIRIANGGTNMPAYAATLDSSEINQILTFLKSRSAYSKPTE